MMRTYVFGNPSGWTLYEGEASEHDYYRSFYVSSRHGSRLMVNRREDGSVAYTYVHYDLIEGSDRMGSAHFGMSIVLDNGQYTDDFNTVYRFLDVLFNKSLERADSLLMDSGDGTLRYRMTKLETGRECIEWIKSMMPKIFDKTGLKSIYADPSFTEGQAGRIVMFETETSNDEILKAFHENNWIAISSDYHKPSEHNVNAEFKEEINLFDIQHQHSVITKNLLDISTGIIEYSPVIIDKINHRINETRLTLHNYITTNPDDVDSVKSLLKQYSDLLDSLDAVRNKAQKSSHTINSNHNSTQQTDTPPHGSSKKVLSDSKNDINTDTPIKMTEVFKSFIQKNISKIGGVMAIVLIMAAISCWLIFFRGGSSIAMGTTDFSTEGVDESMDTTILIQTIDRLLEQKNFKDAYAQIKDTVKMTTQIERIKTAVENHLWGLIEAESGATNIAYFFNDNEWLSQVGFNHENTNDAPTWNTRAELAQTLRDILSKDRINKSQYDQGRNIITTLGSRYSDKTSILNAKYTQSTNLASIDTHQKSPWVTVNEETKEFGSNNACDFTVTKGKNFTLVGSDRISYQDDPNISATPDPKSERTQWTFSFKETGTYSLTLTHNNTTYRIIFTVQ